MIRDVRDNRRKDRMLILAVDTTTSYSSVALLDNTRLVSEINMESALTHSSRLLKSIDDMLRSSGLAMTDMDGFAVASGPGSFTGIRIGLSTVKSFAFASGKPVAPVSSLRCLAWKLRDSQGRLICPIIDAKKGEVYAALFESVGGGLNEVISQGAYKPDFFLSRLPAHRLITFIGNGLPLCRDRIVDYIKDKARFSSRSPFIACEVGYLGHEILKKNKGVPAAGLEPLYFRKSQAEEKD
jgi:tRNA threonylcarbamoyladenosine biosynthesis protein TsaB